MLLLEVEERRDFDELEGNVIVVEERSLGAGLEWGKMGAERDFEVLPVEDFEGLPLLPPLPSPLFELLLLL